VPYAVAIRMRDEGLGDEVIAIALDVDEGEMALLMLIADSKLLNLMTLDASDPRPNAAIAHVANEANHLDEEDRHAS
jgi:hypothetical protein